MYDLSWLNPTPHAIAVYASQPTSPLATQHSLPSGRCPLLEPDLHRLDRTSSPGALIRSPRRRATKATHEWTDLKRQRFASSRHARIWLAVRSARQLDWLLGALSQQERQLAYTAQGGWV